MNKIALQVKISPDEAGAVETLRSLAQGFSRLGWQAEFYGSGPRGLVNSSNPPVDFEGKVIDLSGALTAAAQDITKSSGKPLCSIILVVNGGVEKLRECAELIRSVTGVSDYELIAVLDGGAEIKENLELNGLQTRFIRNLKPLGYFNSCNVGASLARGKHLIFLSESVKPSPGWLENLIHPVEANQEIGVVGAKLLEPGGAVWHAGIIVNENNRIEYAGQGLPADSPEVNYFADGPAVSGACMLVRSDVFTEIGGFDEDYGDNFAEVDFCWNVRNLNKRVVYEPKCSAVIESGGFRGADTGAQEQQDKFFHRFEKKWLRLTAKKPVRVAVDIRTYDRGHTSLRGIGRNVKSQLEALRKYSSLAQITLLYDKAAGANPALAEIGWQMKPYDDFDPADYDVLHLTDPLNFIEELPLLPSNADGIKVVSNFYDLIPLIFARGYFPEDGRDKQVYKNRLTELSGNADLFLTISENTASDLHNYLSIPEERLLNMRCGVDREFFRDDKSPANGELAERLNIDKPFILYSGSHDYRKRVDLLFKAFTRIHREMKGDVQLVMTGVYIDAFAGAIEKLCPDPAARRDIRFLGHVPEETLIQLYQAAELFLFPSIYEGFGLPAAEAMASGCPVVACDASSLPEVTYDAALLVAPGDADSLAEAALKILQDTELKKELSDKGRFWASRTTWDKAAQKTLEGYLTLASKINFQQPEAAAEKDAPRQTAPPAAETPPTEDHRSEIKKLKVTVEGVFLDKSGYALHTRNMALGLDRLGADVELIPCWFAGAPDIVEVDPAAPREEGCLYLDDGGGKTYSYRPYTEPDITGRIVELCDKRSDPSNRTLLVNLPAGSPTDKTYQRIRERKDGFKRYIGYTMMETADLPEGWVEACECMDEIWVPTKFNLETFIRAGVPREKIKIVPLGVDTNYFDPEQTPPMQIPGVKGFNFLSIFQWTKRKGWDILLKAYLQAFTQADDVALVIRSYYRSGQEVETRIREYISGLGYDVARIPRISVISQPITAKHMPALYKACDAFVLPTRGEGWGLPYLEAMAMGLPVIGARFSAHLDFMNDENSYLIDNLGLEPVDEDQAQDSPLYKGASWGKPSLEHTAELMRYVYEHRDEAVAKGKKALQEVRAMWTVERQVERTAEALLEGAKDPSAVEPESAKIPESVPEVHIPRKDKPLRIVMQNRPNSFENPGGDTEVMRHLQRELQRKGLKVDFNFTLEGLENYDIVHVFNFVLPEMVKLYSENAARRGKPVVITPMYEDWPLFLNQSFKTFYLFKEYIERGQPKDAYEQIFTSLKRLKPHHKADNSYNLRLAAAVTPSGHSEADRILQDYPHARNVVPMYLGCNLPAAEVDADLFIRETGLKDFVFCVGRVETRKNQLMLLKALEDEEVPLVFAAGGFTYQPEYLELCQRFQRKGKTIFLGRLSDEMLVSAYKAAKVHALPSWYELPGMVSVEAAHYDCNVVASPWGTIRDYLGNYAYYAEPDDPDEIRRAVMKALQEPVKPGLAEHVRSFTWESAAETLIQVYESILSEQGDLNEKLHEASQRQAAGNIDQAAEFYRRVLELHPDNQKALETLSEMMAVKGDSEALQHRSRLEIIASERERQCQVNLPAKFDENFRFDEVDDLDRAFHLLENGSYTEAEELLRDTLKTDEENYRALYGLGKVYFLKEKYSEAKNYLEKSTRIHPTGESLLTLAGALEKLNQCDQALRALDLISGLPGINGNFDFDINRLRGHCMLRKGRFEEAEACYRKALSIDESSEKPYLGLGSLELMRGSFANAENSFAKALERNPHSDKARLGLALVRLEQGQEHEAFDEARRALDANIENQQAMLVCIKAGLKANRLETTEQYLSKYIELHPANTEILFTLAGVRYRLGDIEGAREAAECILIFKPDHQPAKELLEQLG